MSHAQKKLIDPSITTEMKNKVAFSYFYLDTTEIATEHLKFKIVFANR